MNPATQLHMILTGWQVPPDSNSETVRGDPAMMDMSFWHFHAHAVALIRELEKLLAARSISNPEFGEMTEMIPWLYRAVFAVNLRWGAAGNTARILDEGRMRELKYIGLALADSYPTANISSLKPLYETLEEAAELMREELAKPSGQRAVPRHVAEHVLTLINDAITAIEHGQLADRDVQSAAETAIGSMATMVGAYGADAPADSFIAKIRAKVVVGVGAIVGAFFIGAAEHGGALALDWVVSTPAAPPAAEVVAEAPAELDLNSPVQIDIEPAPGGC